MLLPQCCMCTDVLWMTSGMAILSTSLLSCFQKCNSNRSSWKREPRANDPRKEKVHHLCTCAEHSRVLYVLEPHGIVPIGALFLGLYIDHYYPQLYPYIFVATVLTKLPIFRQIYIWLGTALFAENSECRMHSSKEEDDWTHYTNDRTEYV